MRNALVLALACASLLILDGGTASSAVSARPPSALSAFSNAWSAVTAYNATITVFEQQGTKVQNVIFKYTFRKPSTVTVDVVGGPNNGVSLLWTGGTTVSAHRGSGLAGVFNETMSLHDPRVTTIRGSSIDELSLGHVLAHAQQTPGKISQGGGPMINGVATDAVTLVPANPAADAGYTRERIEISRVTHFPLRVLGYQGPTLVRRIDFVDLKVTR
jgi:outer membrane lipoprotein-sorting protein